MANLALLENYKKGYGASFITLTYDDNHLPIAIKPLQKGEILMESTLVKEHAQKYMQIMRRYIKKSDIKCNKNYSWILAGEYGDEGLRPHYHIVVIGVSAEQWAKVSKNVWTIGTQKIETLKGTAGISYVTSYFSQSINRKEANRIREEYGIESPFISKSRGMGTETIYKNLEKWKETGLRYYTKGKMIPLPRAIREKIDKTEGIRYVKKPEELKQTISDARKYGFDNVINYQKWRDWIKDYNATWRSRRQGNSEKNNYALIRQRPEKINYLQGETEI